MSLSLDVILAAAAYRIWRLAARDDLLRPFRSRLVGRWAAKPDGAAWIDGLDCAWCLGSLISFALVGAAAQIRPIELPALHALAVATAVGLIGRLDD